MYHSSFRRLIPQTCQIFSVSSTSFHTQSPCLAAVKKTTSAAGGVMGLGKGKKRGKIGIIEKKELPFESDPEKLVNYVCGSNIYVTGEDVKIKPDSEYPEWLWSLRTGAPPKIEDLDPDTKEYWIRVRSAGMKRNNKILSLKKIR